MAEQLPPHFHRLDRISEQDIVPDPIIYEDLPVSAEEGRFAVVRNGSAFELHKFVDGGWHQMSGSAFDPATDGTFLDPVSSAEFMDDFLGGDMDSPTTGDSTMGELGWTVRQIGGTGGAGASLGDNNHPGILRLVTGNTQNQGPYLTLGNQAENFGELIPDSGRRITIIVGASTGGQDHVTMRFGLSDDPSNISGGVQGIFWAITNSSDWRGVARDASSNTTTAGELPDGNFHQFKIVITSSSVDFYFDGALKGSLTTGLPTGTDKGQPFIHVITTENASHNVLVDYFYIRYEGLAR